MTEADQGSWKWNLIWEMFVKEDDRLVLLMLASSVLIRDKKLWHYSAGFLFLVKSAFHLSSELASQKRSPDKAETSAANEVKRVWQKLWGLQVHLKVWKYWGVGTR